MGIRSAPACASYDVVVIGSGMGGGTLAFALRDSGLSVLVLERGGVIPNEPENWDTEAIFGDQHRYRTNEQWQDGDGDWFTPGITYAVGGNTKVYGASLPRFRPQDFEAVEHADGVSPAWPIAYAGMEPHYAAAEHLYGVHAGPAADDEPPRSGPFPYPAVPHEPLVASVAERLRARGYHPAHLPLGIDLRDGGACIRCTTCDGYVCKLDAKADAHVRCVLPAVATGAVELVTGAYVRRLVAAPDGRRVAAVEIDHGGEVLTIGAGRVVVAAGAVNSAALLLRSADGGLANGSGAVGRHYLVHNNSVMLTVHPLHRNETVFQKTLYVNDFYERGTDAHPFPLGHMQLIGKVRVPMVKGQAPRGVPDAVLHYVTARSLDWWLFSEDLPDPANRVELTPAGRIRIRWKPNNVAAHEALVHEAKRMARAAGYPIVLTRRAGVDVCSHQAGTLRAGTDPATSVVDAECRSHDLENLYVADASSFASLPVMNPALTIAANALRVAEVVARDAANGPG